MYIYIYIIISYTNHYNEASSKIILEDPYEPIALAASGRSGWDSPPDKSRFHSRPQEVQHISEDRSECLGDFRIFTSISLWFNHGLTTGI